MTQKPTTLHIYLNNIVSHQPTCGSFNQIDCHVELFSVKTCCPTMEICSIKRDHGPSGQLRLLLAEFAPAHHTTASHTHACCEAALWPSTPCPDTSPLHKASNVAMRPVHLSERGKVQSHLPPTGNRDRLNNTLQFAMPGTL